MNAVGVAFLGFFFFSCCTLWSQDKKLHSVYFDFDKDQIVKPQQSELDAFIQTIDTSKIASITIYGYCDDRGKDQYNYQLSERRATAVQNKILDAGIKNKVIVHIEGKGRVLLESDYVDNITNQRQKNRRVDVTLNFYEISDIPEYAVYTGLHDSLKEGDRVVLQNIQFEQGSSKLKSKGKKQLREIAKYLKAHPYFNFQIHGHVCCTPKRYFEAFDKHTNRRELSHNRAKQVYEYLIIQKVPQDRMSFIGCGNEFPLNLTPDLDRRVEFYIVDSFTDSLSAAL